ncbi:AAA family ATPase [Kitasatospora sp. NPDC003701]
MTWTPYYRGDGVAGSPPLGTPPPWREFPRTSQHAQYQPPPGMVDAVNAALYLRRPLLVTGPAGSGKSTVIEQVAHEAGLGSVLRWHITSRSTLAEALYRYDALGRIHAQSLRTATGPRTGALARRAERHRGDDIGQFLQLGQLGTALVDTPTGRPRALLIDEIDKSDLDLPSDLLEVLERGEFEIPELTRYHRKKVKVRLWADQETHLIDGGRVHCSQFPFIVMTSNGERDFPSAFLRRCIRYNMPRLTQESLVSIVRAHLARIDETETLALVTDFAHRLEAGEHLAVDQLLNAAALLAHDGVPTGSQRTELQALLLQELGRD